MKVMNSGMKIIYPEVCDAEKYTKYFINPGILSIYLAGGMNNTNWQESVISTLEKSTYADRLVVFVPKNVEGLSDEDRIIWEHKCLDNSDIHSFYFESSGLHPMACFELGTIVSEFQEIDDIINPCSTVISFGKTNSTNSCLLATSLNRSFYKSSIRLINHMLVRSGISEDEIPKFREKLLEDVLEKTPEEHGEKLIKLIDKLAREREILKFTGSIELVPAEMIESTEMFMCLDPEFKHFTY